MAYVPVPKDLTKVKTKVALNLTKRQLIFFSLAAVVGIPFYLFMRKPIGSSIAAILMVTIMLPFFFMAMYEKDGLPFEKVVANIIRQKFICPAVRPYKTENFYQEISTLVKKEGVPDGKKDKAGGSAGASVPGGKKKPSGKKKQKNQKRWMMVMRVHQMSKKSRIRMMNRIIQIRLKLKSTEWKPKRLRKPRQVC